MAGFAPITTKTTGNVKFQIKKGTYFCAVVFKIKTKTN